MTVDLIWSAEGGRKLTVVSFFVIFTSGSAFGSAVVNDQIVAYKRVDNCILKVYNAIRSLITLLGNGAPICFESLLPITDRIYNNVLNISTQGVKRLMVLYKLLKPGLLQA